MATVDETSAGGLVLDPDRLHAVLIGRLDRHGELLWSLPKGHIEDGKISMSWNLPRLLLPKNRVKLLLNMLVIAQQTIPRGGVLTVDPISAGEAAGFRVAATGLNVRMPQAIADLLSSGPIGSVDAHAVQPYYTRLLAQACGLHVVLAPDGDAVVVTAS